MIALGAPAALWMWSIAGRERKASADKQISIPADLPPGITFRDDIIINNSGEKPLFLSAKCTHLGCRIENIEGDRLVCPCHGSQYDLGGNVERGPATKSLPRLGWEYDKSRSYIYITLA